MDMLSTDVSRMILSIEHESSSRIKEIRQEAIHEYSMIKEKVVTDRRQQLERELSGRCAELEQAKRRAEGCLRREYKIKKEMVRAGIFDAVFRKAECALEAQHMSKTVLEDALAKIHSDDLYIFCREKDAGVVRKAIGTRFEIKSLPDEGIGGVIVCTKDGKEVWDNCFRTRLQILRDSHMDLLNKALLR